VKHDDPDRQLAAALGKVPSGLFILTLTRDGIDTGMLASWVQQCSFRPPQVSLAINAQRTVGPLLTKGLTLTLNILEDSQTDMIAHFGKGFAVTDSAFEGLDVTRRPGAGAILNEAIGYLDAEVVDRFPAGDHDLIVARVTAGRLLDDGHPMVHIRKNGLHY
jgi:flavin reductase (DIM6/NTAB) family NADH-FMN oxidoreductase RutF